MIGSAIDALRKMASLPFLSDFKCSHIAWKTLIQAVGSRLIACMHVQLRLKETAADYEYELFSVVIHRGQAQSGHYFAYTRDLLNQGKLQPDGLIRHIVDISPHC
jgi:ubiquitin C-terminal hydrolase